MNPEPKTPAPNDRKITDQMAALKRIRAAAAGVPVGWGPGDVIPSTARALERAGLVVVSRDRKTVFPAPKN